MLGTRTQMSQPSYGQVFPDKSLEMLLQTSCMDGSTLQENFHLQWDLLAASTERISSTSPTTVVRHPKTTSWKVSLSTTVHLTVSTRLPSMNLVLDCHTQHSATPISRLKRTRLPQHTFLLQDQQPQRLLSAPSAMTLPTTFSQQASTRSHSTSTHT